MARILAYFFLSLIICTSKSYAEEEDWMPQDRHLEAASQGKDCSIFRSIAAKSRQSLELAKDAELHFSELLKVRRSDLIACAQLHRIELDGEVDAEELAAEVCASEYDQWIRTGFRLRAVRQDKESAARSIDVLGGSLERYCAHPAEYASSALRVR